MVSSPKVNFSSNCADIAIPGHQSGDHGGIIWYEPEEELIQLGPAPPEILISDETSETARLPFFEDEWAATDGRVLVPLCGVDRAFGIEYGLEDMRWDDACAARSGEK